MFSELCKRAKRKGVTLRIKSSAGQDCFYNYFLREYSDYPNYWKSKLAEFKIPKSPRTGTESYTRKSIVACDFDPPVLKYSSRTPKTVFQERIWTPWEWTMPRSSIVHTWLDNSVVDSNSLRFDLGETKHNCGNDIFWNMDSQSNASHTNSEKSFKLAWKWERKLKSESKRKLKPRYKFLSDANHDFSCSSSSDDSSTSIMETTLEPRPASEQAQWCKHSRVFSREFSCAKVEVCSDRNNNLVKNGISRSSLRRQSSQHPSKSMQSSNFYTSWTFPTASSCAKEGNNYAAVHGNTGNGMNEPCVWDDGDDLDILVIGLTDKERMEF